MILTCLSWTLVAGRSLWRPQATLSILFQFHYTTEKLIWLCWMASNGLSSVSFSWLMRIVSSLVSEISSSCSPMAVRFLSPTWSLQSPLSSSYGSTVRCLSFSSFYLLATIQVFHQSLMSPKSAGFPAISEMSIGWSWRLDRHNSSWRYQGRYLQHPSSSWYRRPSQLWSAGVQFIGQTYWHSSVSTVTHLLAWSWNSLT